MGCPIDCSGSKADPKNGCPTCDYTIHYQRFERDCEKAFKRGSETRQDDLDWPLNKIIETLGIVSRANGQTRRGYHPRWSVTTAQMVDVYRDEVSRMKAIDSWNHSQEMKALLDGFNRGGSGSDDDEGQ